MTLRVAPLICAMTLMAPCNKVLAVTRTRPTGIDPAAVALLDSMAAAYGGLRYLDQTTTFTSQVVSSKGAPDGGSLDKPTPLSRVIRLQFARPNRLNLTATDSGPNGEPVVSRWVCDGKTFWSYLSDKKSYTIEKAPGSIHQFVRLDHLPDSSLELLMLMGVNPFKDVARAADSVRLLKSATISGVDTGVVELRTTTPQATTVVDLYIGAGDHLLHECAVTTIPARQNAHPGLVGDGLDALATDGETSQPGAPAQILETRLAYANSFVGQPSFTGLTFSFQPPAGSSLYEPYDVSGKIAREQYKNLLKKLMGSKPEKKHRGLKVIHY
ncbi:MAG: DUF2092 domain-containing protein [Armatimonadetes bacterium]|nr:DUF2092 domain-containing protein [Armatimonadota bacterium]MDE2205129.1 DUF2092 domain-containing protein [Armatimonadota bacterium]